MAFNMWIFMYLILHKVFLGCNFKKEIFDHE